MPDRLKGEAEVSYTANQMVLHFLWPMMRFVLIQLISILILKAICVTSYLTGF